MARACGKAILLGEHAVVYGVPALVAGLERGVEARARPRQGPRSSLSIDGKTRIEEGDGSELGEALRALIDACGRGEAVAIEATSELPQGAGLGSSAALAVAAARAVSELRGEAASAAEEQARALAWERVFHGNPSGIDTAAAAAGGCLRYVRGQPPEPVRLKAPLTLALGHSGQGASTRAMVDQVARHRARRPELFEQQLEALRSLVGNARVALETGDLRGLGQLMDLNQMILSGWMLSTTEIEALCALARQSGALGAKLTGSGGGGCVVALCAGDALDVLEAWRAAGFEAFSSPVAL